MIEDLFGDKVDAATQLDTVPVPGESVYLPWSFSRVDAANSCLYKFYKIYYENNRESSGALTLGSIAHTVIAAMLRNKVTNIDIAQHLLAEEITKAHMDPLGETATEAEHMLPYMISFVNNWYTFLDAKGIKKCRIEHPYGLHKDGSRATFYDASGLNCYIRGIVDLWAYDPKTQELYIVDHKTNNKSQSHKQVKECIQLKFYAGMLALFYRLPFKKAHIALNFLKKERITWATVTLGETYNFMVSFFKLLQDLEVKIFDAENSLVWEPQPSFKCSYCSFRKICPGKGDHNVTH